MRKFQFPLETALGWRRRQLEQEEAAMKHGLAELRAVEAAIEQLAAERDHAGRHVLSIREIEGRDLQALARYNEGARERERKLAESKQACERKVEAQRSRMLEARRKVKLIEKLRERRLAEWQADSDKELENLAAEVYLAQWPERQKG